MAHDHRIITAEDVKRVLPSFSKEQILEIDQEIHDYRETHLLSKASETAFSAWEDTEEDIYSERDV